MTHHDISKPPACRQQQVHGDCACCAEAEEWGFAVEQEIEEVLGAIRDLVDGYLEGDRTQPVDPPPNDKTQPVNEVGRTSATYEGRQGFYISTDTGILWRDEGSGRRLHLAAADATAAKALGVLVEEVTS